MINHKNIFYHDFITKLTINNGIFLSMPKLKIRKKKYDHYQNPTHSAMTIFNLWIEMNIKSLCFSFGFFWRRCAFLSVGLGNDLKSWMKSTYILSDRTAQHGGAPNSKWRREFWSRSKPSNGCLLRIKDAARPPAYMARHKCSGSS